MTSSSRGSGTPTCCTCSSWDIGYAKLNAPILTAQARNPQLTASDDFAFLPWHFCPWCGNALGSIPEPSAPAGAPRGKDSDECQTCRHTRYYHGEDATQLPGCITTGCGCPVFVDSARGVQGGEATAPRNCPACGASPGGYHAPSCEHWAGDRWLSPSDTAALRAELSTARAALEERTRELAEADDIITLLRAGGSGVETPRAEPPQ